MCFPHLILDNLTNNSLICRFWCSSCISGFTSDYTPLRLWTAESPCVCEASIRTSCGLLHSNSMELCASINGWRKPSCSPAGFPIKPRCLQHYQRASNWESGVAPPSYSDACQGLLTFWVQWDVKRLFKRMGDWGWLTTPLFISFTPSTAPRSILQRDGGGITR